MGISLKPSRRPNLSVLSFILRQRGRGQPPAFLCLADRGTKTNSGDILAGPAAVPAPRRSLAVRRQKSGELGKFRGKLSSKCANRRLHRTPPPPVVNRGNSQVSYGGPSSQREVPRGAALPGAPAVQASALQVGDRRLRRAEDGACHQDASALCVGSPPRTASRAGPRPALVGPGRPVRPSSQWGSPGAAGQVPAGPALTAAFFITTLVSLSLSAQAGHPELRQGPVQGPPFLSIQEEIWQKRKPQKNQPGSSDFWI